MITTLSLEHVDFLACNTLLHDKYKSYFSVLSQNSNVVIGASIDSTGNIKYGGDWVLENTMENIKTVYFKDTISNYASVLNATGSGVVVDPNDSTISFFYEWNSNDNTAWISTGNFTYSSGYQGTNNDVVIPATIEVDSVTYNVVELKYAVFNGLGIHTISFPASMNNGILTR